MPIPRRTPRTRALRAEAHKRRGERGERRKSRLQFHKQPFNQSGRYRIPRASQPGRLRNLRNCCALTYPFRKPQNRDIC